HNMNLEKYLVVAGMPGVHKVTASRNNGFVIEDLNEGRSRFVPMRQQQVTPLATVGIYTYSEADGENTIPLADVFQKMLDQYETTPPVSLDSNSAAFRAYFTTVLPEHDQDRVHINDIKKCIKWFKYMYEKGIFEEVKREEEKAKAESTGEVEKTDVVETTDAAETAAEPSEKD
ncbi:MAG TPA: DUF5606 domain-containing protein, partial [Saprospiraceae bacterium]|nr:DUF5606 domain-containing protein [Saprospiraceae bacterium]HPI08911.1 DUF5606 domain-containing protein [Saprospiraceae bacterium]